MQTWNAGAGRFCAGAETFTLILQIFHFGKPPISTASAAFGVIWHRDPTSAQGSLASVPDESGWAKRFCFRYNLKT
jgi:hypothetical protein